jgi:hypothetical protein
VLDGWEMMLFDRVLVSKNSLTEPRADLEIKDAQLIFNRVWKELETNIGRENLRFPKELILLGGAPGSGADCGESVIEHT